MASHSRHQNRHGLPYSGGGYGTMNTSLNASRDRPDQSFNPVERVILSLLGVEGSNGAKFEPVKGPTWMQKEVFVVLRSLLGEDGIRPLYEPHKLGMYSEEVEHLVAGLRADGLIESGADGPITLTGKGRTVASRILSSGKRGVEVAREVKTLLNGLEFPDLIIYVYSAYPGWQESSEVAHYLNNKARREALGLRLCREGKISAERASQVAGKPFRSFLSMLNTEGINGR